MIRELGGAVERSFARGEIVARQGDPSSFVYLVQSGIVKLSAVSAGGREALVDLLGPGEAFGETGLFDPETHPATVRALLDCRVAILPHEIVRRELERNPELAVALLRATAGRLARTSGRLEELLLHDVHTRVSMRLATLARDHGKPCDRGILVEPPLTQQDLAQMVGSCRETVNKVIASIAARGLIRIEGRRYVVPDVDALLTSTGGPMFC